jgi:hypothetical protein
VSSHLIVCVGYMRILGVFKGGGGVVTITAAYNRGYVISVCRNVPAVVLSLTVHIPSRFCAMCLFGVQSRGTASTGSGRGVADERWCLVSF